MLWINTIVDCVLTLSFRYLFFSCSWLDDPDGSMTSWEGGRAVGQTVEVRVLDSAGCASDRTHLRAVSQWDPIRMTGRSDWDRIGRAEFKDG